METLSINISNALDANVTAQTIEALLPEAVESLKKVEEGTAPGNDYLGWVKLPGTITEAELDDITETANALREKCEVVVAIGIGGSYLGAKAVVEAMADTFAAYRNDGKTKLLFAGHNIGEDYLYEMLDYLSDKQFGLVVISKSGTTTEPAIAFRLLRELLEKQVGKEEASKRIVAITDRARGALRTMATAEGWKTFVIPDNVGGRFSVLTPVGLLPIAVAGCDIRALVDGAIEMERITSNTTYEENPALLYAATRNALYRAGKKIELLVDYNPKLHYMAEWWKQLYGESEGKDKKGIFPASVDNSTDLHSMGQWVQDGERTLFETVVSVATSKHTLVIPNDEDNLDALNYIAGKRVDQVNKMAELGTSIAHIDGGVPNIKITIPALTEEYVGQLIYFFEKACGISGYMLDVNPFNQPGVEAYKRNMFALLEKPGYEEDTKKIKARL